MIADQTVETSPLFPDLADTDQRDRVHIFVRTCIVTIITVSVFLLY
jgi:hypothetical protein